MARISPRDYSSAATEFAAAIPSFIQRLLDGERPVIYGDGEQTRDFVSVTDVVRANLLAANSDCSNAVCNVAAGERLTINELVDTLNDLVGTTLEPRYDDPRPGDVRHSGADISRARSLLGYEPEVGVRDGLAETVAFFRQQRSS